jgi:hypothetical protein
MATPATGPPLSPSDDLSDESPWSVGFSSFRSVDDALDEVVSWLAEFVSKNPVLAVVSTGCVVGGTITLVKIRPEAD